MDKYRIGVEITEKNMQVAVVIRQKTKWQLLETARLSTMADNLLQLLQSWRRSLMQPRRPVIFSISSHKILMKEIQLDPTLTNHEVYQYLQQQAPTLFGRPANHWYLDFESQQDHRLRAVAASRTDIDPYLKIFHKSRLKVHAVEADVFSIIRLSHTLQGYQANHSQALLWLKASELRFIVFQNYQLIYTKSSAYSPDQTAEAALSPLLQFFNGLYPQQKLTNILLLNENESTDCPHSTLPTAALNPDIWNIPCTVKAQAFCSLGLAIYGD